MAIPKSASAIATHGATNGATLIFLGGYLAIVLYQGNLAALGQQVKTDFLGSGTQPAFWRWAVALLILYALAQTKTAGWLFTPLLVIVLVAMLVETAQAQPTTFANLNAGVKSFFGVGNAQSPNSPGFSPGAASGAATYGA